MVLTIWTMGSSGYSGPSFQQGQRREPKYRGICRILLGRLWPAEDIAGGQLNDIFVKIFVEKVSLSVFAGTAFTMEKDKIRGVHVSYSILKKPPVFPL